MEEYIKVEVNGNIVKVRLNGILCLEYDKKIGKYKFTEGYKVIVIFDFKKKEDFKNILYLLKYNKFKNKIRKSQCSFDGKLFCNKRGKLYESDVIIENLYFNRNENEEVFLILGCILNDYCRGQNNSKDSFVNSMMNVEDYDPIFYEKNLFRYITVNGKRLNQNNNQPNNNNGELTNLMDTTQQIEDQANQSSESTSKDDVNSAINDFDQSEQSQHNSTDQSVSNG